MIFGFFSFFFWGLKKFEISRAIWRIIRTIRFCFVFFHCRTFVQSYHFTWKQKYFTIREVNEVSERKTKRTNERTISNWMYFTWLEITNGTSQSFKHRSSQEPKIFFVCFRFLFFSIFFFVFCFRLFSVCVANVVVFLLFILCVKIRDVEKWINKRMSRWRTNWIDRSHWLMFWNLPNAKNVK